MYCLRVKILTLVTIGYIVGFIVGMYIEYCLWAQMAVLDIYIVYIGLFGIGIYFRNKIRINYPKTTEENVEVYDLDQFDTEYWFNGE